MNITIKERQIELKNKMRAMLIYESILNKPFSPSTATDMMVYLYSIILANVPDIELSFNDMLNEVDRDETILKDFYIWLEKEKEKDSIFNDGAKKKKAKR